jgi:isocitrate/isopropylmalate dehydrogenase
MNTLFTNLIWYLAKKNKYKFFTINKNRKHNKAITITYDQIVNAISDLVNRKVSISTHITDAITSDLASEDYGCHMDAECYDVIIQVALFGDVVYG